MRETKRVLQVGSQTTSGDQWAKAKKAIADGMIGDMIMSQGSYHRNSLDGEWNYPIDNAAGPTGKGEDYLDWKMWLGSAPPRPYNADRYFRFRKYWDYSGGIATDLFYHVVAPMNICWGEPQFPSKVMAGGGIYEFHDEREVPDTFHLIGDYPRGHSLVLSSSMANSQHIPGLIRGHAGTIMMVEHGQFERYTPYITVRPEKRGKQYVDPSWPDRFGNEEEVKIAVPQEDIMQKHIGQLPRLHALAREADARCGNRRAGAGADHDGGDVVPPGQGDVLQRKELAGDGSPAPCIGPTAAKQLPGPNRPQGRVLPFFPEFCTLKRI